MKSKFITILTLGIAACSLLSGCGMQKPPTAEELVLGAYPADMQTMKADMEFEFSASVPMGELGTNSNMEFSMNLDADIEADSNTTLLDGKAKISILGMTVEQNMKEYAQNEGGMTTTYSYNEEEGLWTYATEESEEKENKRSIDPSMFKDLALQETKKEDTEYVVTAVIDMDNMKEVAGMNVEDMMSAAGDEIDYDELTFDAVMVFDKTTKAMKSFEIEMTEPYEQNGAKITYFLIRIEDMEFSNDNVEIPSNVIRDAISEEEYSLMNMMVYNDYEEIPEEDEEDVDVSDVPMLREVSEQPELVREVDEDIETARAGEVEEVIEKEDTAGMSDIHICEEYFGLDFVYEKDLLELAGGKLEEGEDVSLSIMSFLSYYTKDEFMEYVEFWDLLDDRAKLSCSWVSYLGVASYDEMVAAGADADELKTLLTEVNNK